MNLEFIFIFLVIFIFGFISIIEDIKKRRVSNYISFSFIFFGFFYFLFKIYTLVFLDYIFLLISFILSYLMYKYNLWGAADGKIFISLSLILISFNGANFYFIYLINLVIIYSIIMIILSQFKTSIIDKNLAIRNIDYYGLFFILVFSFLIVSIIYSQISIENLKSNLLYFLLAIFSIIYVLTHFAKKYYNKLLKEKKLFINLFLFLLLFLFNNFSFKYYFFILLIIRILIDYISDLTSKIRIKSGRKKIQYNSPFTIYLFLVSLITLLLNENIIVILTKFFM